MAKGGNYLVVGASSGIGRALSQLLAQEGEHEIVGTYCKNQPETDAGVHYHALDVLEDDPDLGFIPDELDGLAYCPGSIELKPFHRIKPDAFRRDYELQVLGAMKVLQHALPSLKKGSDPSVVLFSTVAVQQGFGYHAQVASSKGAIEGLVRSLAAEWAPTVRVNAVAPSVTDTPLSSKLLGSEEKRQANAERHPLKRIGAAEDVAEAAAYLLSDRSAWVTGQVLGVDGGMSAIKG